MGGRTSGLGGPIIHAAALGGLHRFTSPGDRSHSATSSWFPPCCLSPANRCGWSSRDSACSCPRVRSATSGQDGVFRVSYMRPVGFANTNPRTRARSADHGGAGRSPAQKCIIVAVKAPRSHRSAQLRRCLWAVLLAAWLLNIFFRLPGHGWRLWALALPMELTFLAILIAYGVSRLNDGWAQEEADSRAERRRQRLSSHP